jgi:hypothetical protein
LKKGLLRRISDGGGSSSSTTDILHDRWLPGHFEGRPITMPDNL